MERFVGWFQVPGFSVSGFGVCFIALVAFGLAEPMLILFGVADMLGAVWTALALRTSQG